MGTRQGMTSGQDRETHGAQSETAGPTEPYTPRKMTFTENVIMTIKVLAGFGLVGAALWAVSLWTSAK
jgi:hypothetical protein